MQYEKKLTTHYKMTSVHPGTLSQKTGLKFSIKEWAMCFVLAPDNVCDPIIGLVVGCISWDLQTLFGILPNSSYLYGKV